MRTLNRLCLVLLAAVLLLTAPGCLFLKHNKDQVVTVYSAEETVKASPFYYFLIVVFLAILIGSLVAALTMRTHRPPDYLGRDPDTERRGIAAIAALIATIVVVFLTG